MNISIGETFRNANGSDYLILAVLNAPKRSLILAQKGPDAYVTAFVTAETEAHGEWYHGFYGGFADVQSVFAGRVFTEASEIQEGVPA